MKTPIIRLQPQRHKRVLGGHPWVYSNEIVMDEDAKKVAPGSIVEFRAHDKRFIGKGSFNPHSLIAGRIFTWNVTADIDVEWLLVRLREALAVREQLVSEPFYRLVHAEADSLPGLIIDRFGSNLTVQLNTAGMDRLWPELEKALKELLNPASIILRNEGATREMEGLKRETKIAHGSIDGTIEVLENGLTYFADLQGGQKTGWYFDQRDNHALVARYSKDVASVLDLYCHAGGFALLAAKVGAKKVIGVDSSEPALALAKKSAEHNKLDARCSFHQADVFEDLGRRIAGKEKHEVVIADPPAFAKSRKDVTSGGKGYRKLARLAAGVTAPQGLLFIASCSYNMELPNFIEQVSGGLHEANRTGRILYTTFAAPDHPMHPHLPESGYLKGLLIRLN